MSFENYTWSQYGGGLSLDNYVDKTGGSLSTGSLSTGSLSGGSLSTSSLSGSFASLCVPVGLVFIPHRHTDVVPTESIRRFIEDDKYEKMLSLVSHKKKTRKNRLASLP